MTVFTSPNPSRRQRGSRRAFSLIETMVAMVIMTVAITAMCGLLAAGTSANVSGNELTTAVNLADTVHEIAIGLPLSHSDKPMIGSWHDVWDLNGQTFSPPINASRAPMPGYANWSQHVTVRSVDSNNVSLVIPEDRKSATARLTVEIYHEGRLVHTASWLMTADGS